MNATLIVRSHLLIAVSISFVSGIIFSQHLLFSQSLLILLLTTGIAILFYIFKKQDNNAMYMLLLFFALTGILSGSSVLSFPAKPHHIVNIVDHQEEAVVIGKVKRIYGYNGETTRLDVDTLSVRTKNSSFKPSKGIVRYTIKGELAQPIIPGCTLAIRSKLKRPEKYSTPGSFDYPRYLALKDIWLAGYISSPLHIQIVQAETSFPDKLIFSTEVLREKIKLFIDSCLPQNSAALYKALITGDRSSIPPEIIEQFKGAGCMHILAISGLHMSLLGLFLFAVIYWLLRRSEKLILTVNVKKTAAILCVIPLALYTFVAGAQTPVIRSFIMSVVVIVAICSDRKQSIFTLVACAALLILVFSPSDLFTPSFQLTFAAVLSIASIVPILKFLCDSEKEKIGAVNNALNRSWAWLITVIGISLAATLGTAPLLLYHFNRLSLAGPFANIVIEPLICLWSLTAGFVATIFIFIFPPLAVLLFKFGSIGLLLATKSVYFFNSFAFSSVRLPTPSIFQIFFYYLSLIPILHYKHFSRRIRLLSSISLAFSALLFFIPPKELTKYMMRDSTIAILDVGHGSATVIQLPQGKKVLIDGGAISSPDFNIGERVIAPFLWKNGIKKIDDVIVTHPDSDHYNGIPFILQHFEVKRLWINGTEETDQSWQNVLTLAKKNDISIHIPLKNTIVSCSGGACVQVLTNTSQVSEKGTATIKNEESLILKFTHGNFSAIFPGDITVNIEEKLISEQLSLKATLLLAAHHGSKTSNSKAFLETISPRYLAISSRSYNSKTFPALELSSNCNQIGITILETAKSGTITVTSTGKKYSLNTFSPQ